MLHRFQAGLYSCLTRWADVLFELAEAAACATAPVTELAHLSLEIEHRRGRGSLYDALSAGRIDTDRLRSLLIHTAVPTITGPDGIERIVLAVDVSNWLRPDATTSGERLFCHTCGRGPGQAQMTPGWPYSFVCALETGASSWTTLLDVVRLAWLLADLPVVLIGRLRSDRVFRAPAGQRRGPTKGRPPRHGARLVLADPDTHPEPAVVTGNDTARYGCAQAVAFARMHPRFTSRGGWADQPGELPIIAGTVIGLQVQRLPGDREPKPV